MNSQGGNKLLLNSAWSMWANPWDLISNPTSLWVICSSTLSSLNSVIIREKITKIPASIKTVNTSANECYLSSQHGELVIRDWWKTVCLNLDPCHLHQPPPATTKRHQTHTYWVPKRCLKIKENRPVSRMYRDWRSERRKAMKNGWGKKTTSPPPWRLENPPQCSHS